mmetsp:Transcript_22659/g.49521  ORF Transcript_22659/g.49521 Transcript_22659/m.49521 type:complete len:156 (-) Transcript_22659:89-556(-)
MMNFSSKSRKRQQRMASFKVEDLSSSSSYDQDLTQFRSVLRSLLGESECLPSLQQRSGTSTSEQDNQVDESRSSSMDHICLLLAQERACQRESMLTYLHSVQEFIAEEQDEQLRAACIREVFQEIRQQSLAHHGNGCRFAHNKYASDLEHFMVSS